MILDLEYRHVDVFSTHALEGNGLVVVLGADGLSKELMLDVTREVRQFETTFVADLDLVRRSATLRIFTEDEELDFAGHPVIGAGAVLHTLLPEAGPEESWTLSIAGRPLHVRTRPRDGFVECAMDQGTAGFGPLITGELMTAFLDALSLGEADAHPTLPMQVVSTGLPYLIVPVRRGLARARIAHRDFEGALAAVGAKFVYVLDPDRPEGRSWDNTGRVEDVATGSAAGPAAGYLIRHGVASAEDVVVVNQGRFVRRPSTIEVRQHEDGRLWVGGPVAPVAAGRFAASVG